jgi:hypothetical protein
MVQLSQLLFIILPAWIQACSSNDECQNGVCETSWIAAADQGYSPPVCNCRPGYWGYDCRDTCGINCENRGQCHFGTSSDHGGGDIASGEIVCKCPSGWSGPTCGIQETDNGGADSGATNDQNSGANYPASTDPGTTSAEADSSRSAGAKFGITLSAFLILGLVGAVVLKRRRSAKNSTMDPSSSSTATESAEEREFA